MAGSRRTHGGAILAALREAFSGAAIRATAQIVDMGEVLVAKVRNVIGGAHYDADNGRDVYVHYEDLLGATEGGVGGVGRLFFPLNALFGVPATEESCTVVRPRDAGGPGVPLVLWGDAGRSLPSWIRSKIGLWNSKTIRVESTGGDVEVNSDTHDNKNIVLNDGALSVARITDSVNICNLTATAGPYPVIFTMVVLDANGAPLTTVIGPNITISGVISAEMGNGAENVLA
jgi:hypothetical protein